MVGTFCATCQIKGYPCLSNFLIVRVEKIDLKKKYSYKFHEMKLNDFHFS